jgi:transcriptional regulator with XRE-family HTH domain
MGKKKPKTLGERIRSLRGKLTQVEFADLLRIKQPMISRYEADRETPSPRILLRIARHSGASIEWLLTGKDTASKTGRKKTKSAAKRYTTTRDLLESAAAALGYTKRPETGEFVEMMKDLFSSRERMHKVLEYNRYLKFVDKTKSKK